MKSRRHPGTRRASPPQPRPARRARRIPAPRAAAGLVLSDPVFSEPTVNGGVLTPDPTYFVVPHPSDAPLYAELQKLHLIAAHPFPRSRSADADLYPLAGALGSLGPQKIQQIQQAGRIVFHTLGDTGSVKGTATQNLVTDWLVADCHAPAPADRPAFLFHLGDLVYSFADSQYYYDQFYEPYRNYPGPIFSIPGNHDGMLPPNPPRGAATLQTFLRNFCARRPTISRDAASLHRTAMTQPGVYFTLDAPFVRIIGLYSNALEDPGVISSENGRYAAVPDFQLNFLQAQLARIKQEAYAGCVLLAVHHPPFSWVPPAGRPAVHGGSPRMLQQIDELCAAAGVYPHAVLSGHAHNYQRYTRPRQVAGRNCTVPFVVCGSGGHGVNPLAAPGHPSPARPSPAGHLEPGLVLENYDDRRYGYLRVQVDPQTVRIAFCPAGAAGSPASEFDAVSVDLAGHTIINA